MDEVLVHEREDAFIDLLEFSLHFHDALPRVRGLLLVALCPFLLFHDGDDAPGCTSTVNGVLVRDRQQVAFFGFFD